MRNKVLIVGTTPPPIGGVSMHLARLMNKLNNLNGDIDFYDYRRDSLVSLYRKIKNADIIHTNFSSKIIRFLSTILFRMFMKQVVITFHGKYSFTSKMDILSLKFSSMGILLNQYSYENAIRSLNSSRKVRLISAFIPPAEEESIISPKIDYQLNHFSVHFESIVCTNAHNFVLDSKGNDLYGIDFILKIFLDLKNIGLIISDPSGNLSKKYKYFKNKENILFISEPHSFVEVIKISDTFVRATTTDGDSLSVKEALFLGKRVIASDCVDRPNGCEVYSTNNSESFLDVFKSSKKLTLIKPNVVDGSKELIEIYNEF